ncbi:hypothetical protein [Mycobacteroides chelonae]|uniref:hypothetical protein n=1 Tax=Mycobacteroides chelonae TaxID=1774 RepID=UPI0009C01910|nr:hypothetical protein [Mycobacteroides chelonae]
MGANKTQRIAAKEGVQASALPTERGAWAPVFEAIKGFKEAQKERDSFVDEHSDPDGDEPDCGYPKWDEAMADFNVGLADAGEHLAAAIETAFLGLG